MFATALTGNIIYVRVGIEKKTLIFLHGVADENTKDKK